MKRILTALAVLLAACATVFAQGKYQVKGVVEDAMGPVIGATVLEVGTANGVSTGLDGDYILTVSSADATVEISCIGYATQTFKAGAVPARVVLAEDTNFLDEVVVIGYGTVKKSDMTGSVTAIKNEEINRGAIVSTQDMLKGKVAGLQVVPGSGEPGSGSTIRIRGAASLNASNNPLVVIDGVPIAEGAGEGMSNPLESINPNDIESFTVLKDASSAAIYGSRASNGVIMITTKKGTGNRVQVSYNGSMSVQMNSNKLNVMSGQEYVDYITSVYRPGTPTGDIVLENLHLVTDPTTGTYPLDENGNPQYLAANNTDWNSLIFRTAISHEHNISLYGNVKNVFPFRVSLGYSGQQGTLQTSQYDKANLDISLNPQFLDKHLTVNANAKGVYTRQRWADGGAVGTAAFMDPTLDPYFRNDDGSIDYTTANGFFNYGSGRGDTFTQAGQVPDNPLSMLYDKNNVGQVGRFIGNIQLDYKIHGFEDLRLNVNAGMDYSYSGGDSIGAIPGSVFAINDTENPGLGQFTRWMHIRSSQVFEAYANYNKEIGIHHIDAMAGYSYQKSYSEDRDISFFNAGTNRLGVVHEVAEPKLDAGETVDTRYLPNRQQNVLVSFYGRINYSLLGRYLFTFTIRDDMSSRFAPKNRAGIFPSAAFAWNAKEEKFLKNVDALSQLKLRLSWGQTGQQEIGNNYPYLSAYYFSNNPYATYNMGSAGYTKYLTPGAYDPEIKWETTTTYNVGVDYGVLGDRITGTLDVYYRQTDDLLNWVSTPMGANFGNRLLTNVGSMENHGVEFSINTIPIETKDMSLSVGFNGTFQQTKFIKLANYGNDTYYIDEGGISGGTGNTIQRHMVNYAPYTFYAFQQVYDENGKPVQGALVDRNKNGQIDSGDRYMTGKSPNPDFFYGLNVKFSYKNWDFGFNGHGSVGNWVYNNVKADNSSTSQNFSSPSLTNYLRSQPQVGFTSPNTVEQYASDYFLENASFFRLDDINLGYTFGKLGNWKNANLRIGLSVQNVFVITGYSGLDPEIGGIDGSMWPRPRTFSLRANLNF